MLKKIYNLENSNNVGKKSIVPREPHVYSQKEPSDGHKSLPENPKYHQLSIFCNQTKTKKSKHSNLLHNHFLSLKLTTFIYLYFIS